MKSLALLALQHAVPIDRLRKIVRRLPELAAMGQRFGPTRLLNDQECDAILKAYYADESKRKRVVSR